MNILGDLKAVSVVPSEYGISMIVNYIFSFTTSNLVTSNGYLDILFPDEVLFTSSTKCKLNTYISCEIINNNMLRIYSFPSDFYAGQISLTIENLQNYRITTISGAFTLTTKTHDGYSIDSYTGNSITFICYSPCETCENSPDSCKSCVPTSDKPYF